MAQISIVRFDKLKSDSQNMRIDSEYFKEEYIKIENMLNKISKHDLKSLNAKIKHPTEIKREYVEKGVLFVRAQNVRPLLMDLKNKIFISDKDAKILGKNKINYEDILITRTGANFGQVSINVNKTLMIGSSHTFILNNLKISPFFIVVFLNTRYGRKMIDKGMYGGLQPEIAPYYLYKIPVPLLDKKEFIGQIDSFFKEAIKRIDTSRNLFQEAEQILLDALSLKDYKPKQELSFDANLSEVLSSKRIDSEYYQPKYKLVEEKIRKVKHDNLGRLFDFIKGFEVGGDAYQEEGIPYLRVSNLEVLELDWSNPNFISEELFNQLKENHQPQKGEILLSKDGTPGIAYFIRDDIKSINSSGILRLKLKENKKVNLSYMTLVLNSILIQQQIDRDSGGAIIKHWRPEEIKNTLVPLLDDEIQKIIASKLDESYRLRKESKELLEKAKKMVEDEIEKEAKK